MSDSYSRSQVGLSLVDLCLKWPLKGGRNCEHKITILISHYHRYKRTSQIYQDVNHIALVLIGDSAHSNPTMS